MPLDDYLEGHHLTAITVQYGNPDVAGNIVYIAAQDIHAYISEVGPEYRRDTQDVRPVWKRQMNHIVTGEGHFLTVVALQRSAAVNVLAQAPAYKYAKLAWAQGAESYVIEFTIAGYDGGVRDRASNPATLRLEPCDTNNVNGQAQLNGAKLGL